MGPGKAAPGARAAGPELPAPSASAVEERLLEAAGGFPLRLAGERLGIVTAPSPPALGRAVALRFLEWALAHPDGVCSLPTGRTPEHFINSVRRLLGGWATPAVQAELQAAGLRPGPARPDLRRLTFVQMDEYLPVDPSQRTSYASYIRRYYLEGFGLDPGKALLMDTWRPREVRGLLDGDGDADGPGYESLGELFAEGVDEGLRFREPVDARERAQAAALRGVDQYCAAYEARIRALGGIGFFLGGIGPDGHLAFNCAGSDPRSVTRLTRLNYMSEAAAAGDLGGISNVKKHSVVTIGLGTITARADVVAIVFAAGEAKARVVADAAGRPDVPVAALHACPHARLYLTTSATARLARRQDEAFRRAALAAGPAVREDGELIQRTMVDLSLRAGKPLAELGEADIEGDCRARLLRDLGAGGEGGGSSAGMAALTLTALARKKERGAATPFPGQTVLHTAPHHDDIMLAYLGWIRRMLDRDHPDVPEEDRTRHCFCYCTSGFNSVTSDLMVALLTAALGHLRGLLRRGADLRHLAPEAPPEERERDAEIYLRGHWLHREAERQEGLSRRMLRNVLRELPAARPTGRPPDVDGPRLAACVETAVAYYRHHSAGVAEEAPYRVLKGALREFEGDLVWKFHGFQGDRVRHLRMGFYKGETFSEDPEIERDVLPLVDLMDEVRPDAVTVALDPEGSGPDTHYKVLQAVAAAVEHHRQRHPGRDLRIFGYRNVWFRFHLAEASHLVPVTAGDFAHLNDAFQACFLSQKRAEFPSPYYVGPFSHVAQHVQAEQLVELRRVLGPESLVQHPDLARSAGLILVKEFKVDDFKLWCRKLRAGVESV